MPSRTQNKTHRQRDIFRQWNQSLGWQKMLEFVSAIENANTLYYVKDKLSDDEYAERVSMLHGQIRAKLKSIKIPVNSKIYMVLRSFVGGLENAYTYREALLATQQFTATCLKRA